MSELYKKLVGSHKKQADAVLKLKDTFATSWWVSLDPGSNSCGYALWNGLELVESGSLTAKGTIGPRLSQISFKLRAVLDKHKAKPSIVVTELVRCSTGHHYLTWSAGMLVAAAGAEHTLEASTGAWKKNTDSTYVKGDERDAIEIGKYAATLVRESATIKRRRNAKYPRLRSRWNNSKG